MKNTYLLIMLLVGISFNSTKAQNLVPNPSFEDTLACPNYSGQINKAESWHASRETPDYYNECDWLNGVTSVPSNFSGFQFAQNGVAYSGFVAAAKNFQNAREYFTCQLNNPLIIGRKYLISFYLSFAGVPGKQLACNKIGALLSTNDFNLTDTAHITNYCQFYTDSIIVDSLNWTKISGEFLADSAYTFLTIGNFFNDSLTDTIQVSPITSYAYYFIDNINLTLDSTTSYENILSDKLTIAYPTLTSGNVRIESYKYPIMSIFVYDKFGNLLLKQFHQTNQFEDFIDLSNFQSGVYFIIINQTTCQAKFKIIKVNN